MSFQECCLHVALLLLSYSGIRTQSPYIFHDNCSWAAYCLWNPYTCCLSDYSGCLVAAAFLVHQGNIPRATWMAPVASFHLSFRDTLRTLKPSGFLYRSFVALPSCFSDPCMSPSRVGITLKPNWDYGPACP